MVYRQDKQVGVKQHALVGATPEDFSLAVYQVAFAI